MANTQTKKQNKKNRDQQFKLASHERFLKQQAAMITPYLGYFGICTLTFLIYMIWDKPSVIFDQSSILFSCMLIAICAVYLVSLIIIKFAKKTTHLLVTQSLHQLTIFPLIVAYLLRYEQLKSANAKHLLLIYFLFTIIYLIITTINFRLKSRYLTSNDEL